MSADIPYEEQIEYILDNFDFDRVREAMRLTGWTWVTEDWSFEKHGTRAPMELPEVERMRRQAREHLRDVAEGGDGYHAGRGGLAAYNVEGRLRLAFEFVEWDAFDMEPRAIAKRAGASAPLN